MSDPHQSDCESHALYAGIQTVPHRSNEFALYGRALSTPEVAEQDIAGTATT